MSGAAAAEGGTGTPALVLIGPMAAGKSRIGRRVAALLDLPFTDTDKVIVARHGDIPTIFRVEGEAVFRAHEREVVAEALRAPGVVSLGGGAVLDLETQAELAVLPVVLLMTTPESVEGRLTSAKRPVLGDGGVARWLEVLEQRRPTYEALARSTVDTSRRPIEHLAREIADWASGRAGIRPDTPERTAP